MNILDIMKERHSVRSYTDKKIDGEVKIKLLSCINKINDESGLNIQGCFDEPEAFDSLLAHYGNFINVKNYIAIVGKKEKGTKEKCGYYGEKIVLRAQELGLNTCWVAMTYSKGKSVCQIGKNEKLVIVIAIGYGATEGIPHKSKKIDELCSVNGEMPEWFRIGIEAASLAPTAMNQQKFMFYLNKNKVNLKYKFAPYGKIDLGIVKYHFEKVAGKENFTWI